MAVTFCKRSLGYKLGVSLLLVGVVVFCVGFATPYWNVTTCSEDYKENEGLWLSCWSTEMIPTKIFCSSLYSDGWFAAVQGMQALSMTGILIAVIYLIFVNFVFNETKRRVARAGEFTALVSVVLGVIGLIVYGIEATKPDWQIKSGNAKCELFGSVKSHHPVLWSFYIDTAGLVVIFIAAVVITINNKPCRLDNTVVCYSALPQTATVSHPANATVRNWGNPATAIVDLAAYALPPDYVMPPPPYVTLQAPVPSWPAGHQDSDMHTAGAMGGGPRPLVNIQLLHAEKN